MENLKEDENSKVSNVSNGDPRTLLLNMENNSQIASLTGNVEVVQLTVSKSEENLLNAEADSEIITSVNTVFITSEIGEEHTMQNKEITDSSDDAKTQVEEVALAIENPSVIGKKILEPLEVNNSKEDCNRTEDVISEIYETLTLKSDGITKNDEANDLSGGSKDESKTQNSVSVSDQVNGQRELDSTSEQLNTFKNHMNVDNELRESLEITDNKTLNENILIKSTELIESMETENSDSILTKQKMMDSKVDSDKPSGSSLSLLAQYMSESDRDSNNDDADCEEDDVVEVPLDSSKDYRNIVIEIKSESESDSSSSDDSDLEYLSTIRKEIQKAIDLDDDEDDDEDGDGTPRKGKKKKKQTEMRVKGEILLEDLPPIQDLHITVPEEECIELGKVHSIIDQLLLVSVLPDSLLLDLETVLFLEKGKKVLGEVFDVLGQVADPLYCVRFNTHKEIEEKGIQVGDTVYVAPKTQYTQFVILSNLMKLRGSDASWENDVEPPPRYIDYSDDEQEREANARLRNQDRPNDHEDPAKRSRSSNDQDATSSSSNSNSQPSHTDDVRRPNRNRSYQHRPPYQRKQSQQNVVHRGSWHSNYRQPYFSYSNMNMMPQQEPNAMQFPYQSPSYQPYLSGQFSPTMPPPQMSPIASPALLPMYVINPLAVAAPRMSNNIYQRIPQSRNSPPPAPPGLD